MSLLLLYQVTSGAGMTTLGSFYAQASAVTNPANRRWALGAAYRLSEYVQFGYSIAAARALVLAAPQYTNGLIAAGLDDDYALIDDLGGGGVGGPTPLAAATQLSAATSLVAGGVA